MSNTTHAATKPDGAATALAALAERFWAFQCHESPLTAIQAGLSTSDAVLLREGPDDYGRRERAARAYLVELDAIPEQGLDAPTWATHRLLRRELEDIVEFHAVRAHERPAIFPLGPEFMPAYWANSTALTRADAAELYVDRLATIPAFLADVRANLSAGHAAGIRYPRLVLERAASLVRANIALGAAFDVRAFHDTLMAAGPVTLPVLDRLVDDYLERTARAA